MSRQQQNTRTPLLNNGAPQRQQQDPKIAQVQGQVRDAQMIMQDNIHMAIKRGENINDLDDKSVLLENESARFKEKSSAVRRNMCLQYYKQIAIFVAIIIAIIVVIVIIAKL
eukprot:UN03694